MTLQSVELAPTQIEPHRGIGIADPDRNDRRRSERAAALLRHSRPVPRYTSYPSAASFGPGVDAATFRRWLGEIDPGESLSLYFHVPFCHSLCWFCGCQTTVTRRPDAIAAYAALLFAEMRLVGEATEGRGTVRRVHFGGGTPTILGAELLRRVMEEARASFSFAADAELAIEVDPRTLDGETASAIGELGFRRASLGVQDLDPLVQKSVNRVQSLDVTVRAATALREAGVSSLNVDLMVGLPHQTETGIHETVGQVLSVLDPDRLAVFAYAHVPWMKRHQRLIAEEALPGPAARLEQGLAAAEALECGGYVPIGLDHFARPDDALAVAAREGRLRRNFQGYTDDQAPSLIGFGASAISSLSQGYAQNAHHVPAYRAAVEAGAPATIRGLVLAAEDRMWGEIIERLMCDLSVDLNEVAARWQVPASLFDEALGRLAPLAADGLVSIDERAVSVPAWARPALRTVSSAFDRHLSPAGKHAPGI